jgi:hypothetical protein
MGCVLAERIILRSEKKSSLAASKGGFNDLVGAKGARHLFGL